MKTIKVQFFITSTVGSVNLVYIIYSILNSIRESSHTDQCGKKQHSFPESLNAHTYKHTYENPLRFSYTRVAHTHIYAPTLAGKVVCKSRDDALQQARAMTILSHRLTTGAWYYILQYTIVYYTIHTTRSSDSEERVTCGGADTTRRSLRRRAKMRLSGGSCLIRNNPHMVRMRHPQQCIRTESGQFKCTARREQHKSRVCLYTVRVMYVCCVFTVYTYNVHVHVLPEQVATVHARKSRKRDRMMPFHDNT